MLDDTILDAAVSTEFRAKYDPQDMMGLVLKFPTQCREAAAITWQYGLGKPESQSITQVIVAGLGGSAIGGDILRALSDMYGTVPITVNRDYFLPKWVNSGSLILAASYSGNTEETLSAVSEATSASLDVASVTSGGKLLEIAQLEGYPYALVPGGQPPRSATGYMFFPALNYLMRHNHFRRDFTEDIEETLSLLEVIAKRLGPGVLTNQNPAKQLALKLYGKLPVIYGSQGYRGVAAYRWKCQFNENTKIAAISNVLPEQNHNEILAWTQAHKQTANWALILLRDPDEKQDSPRIARRVEVTREIVGTDTPVYEITAEGSSTLARIFSLIYMADFVTVYLAYLYGVCPTDIGSIDRLKVELSKLN